MSGSGWEASQMSISVRQTLPNVREWWEALPNVRKTSRIFGSSPEALSDVREWSGNPHGCPGGPLRCPGVFGRPSWMFGRAFRTFPDI